MLNILFCIIILACLGFLFNEGIWANAVRLINVVVACLLAMNYFQPLASWLSEKQPTFTFLWDFLSLWAIFCIALVAFRVVTDRVSRVKVRFLGIADRIGSGVLAVWIAWVLICFTLTTLHAAPLGKNFLFGSFQSDQPMFLGFMSPDKQWLGFVQQVSQGVFFNGSEAPLTTYVKDYEMRRGDLENYAAKSGSIRLNPEAIAPPAPPAPPPGAAPAPGAAVPGAAPNAAPAGAPAAAPNAAVPKPNPAPGGPGR
jgi:hypothetical protein